MLRHHGYRVASSSLSLSHHLRSLHLHITSLLVIPTDPVLVGISEYKLQHGRNKPNRSKPGQEQIHTSEHFVFVDTHRTEHTPRGHGEHLRASMARTQTGIITGILLSNGGKCSTLSAGAECCRSVDTIPHLLEDETT